MQNKIKEGNPQNKQIITASRVSFFVVILMMNDLTHRIQMNVVMQEPLLSNIVFPLAKTKKGIYQASL